MTHRLSIEAIHFKVGVTADAHPRVLTIFLGDLRPFLVTLFLKNFLPFVFFIVLCVECLWHFLYTYYTLSRVSFSVFVRICIFWYCIVFVFVFLTCILSIRFNFSSSGIIEGFLCCEADGWIFIVKILSSSKLRSTASESAAR